MRKFAGTFITGLLAITPFAVTVGLIAFVADALYGFLGPASTFGQWLITMEQALRIPRFVSYPLSIILLLLVIWAIGNLTKLYVGRRISSWAESVISRIPLINKIYHSVDQVVDLVSKKDSPSGPALTNVVVAKLANTTLLGLLANSERIYMEGVPHYLVYVPSAPMPTSGFNYLIPCSDVRDINLTAEELTRIIVSLGSLGPGIMNEKQELLKPVQPDAPPPALSDM